MLKINFYFAMMLTNQTLMGEIYKDQNVWLNVLLKN